MIRTLIILLLLVGCGGEYNTSELVWEQKADSTKTLLDKVQNKEWMDKKSKEFIDKIYKGKEEIKVNLPFWYEFIFFKKNIMLRFRQNKFLSFF